MAINNSLLREKLKKVEAEFDCALSVDKARTLIKKIQKKYKGLQKKRFVSIVKKETKEMGLDYNYCRLMFSYFGSSKKKKNYKEEKIKKQRQMFFNLYNPMVRY